MVVAEVLAGIALVKSSVDFIKSNIDTAKDIGEIAGAIDGLFQGAEQCQKQRNKKSGVSVKDQFGINNVAQEVIDAKLAEEKLQEMRTLVDMRFGPGTWQSILDLRAKRIQEEKEALKEYGSSSSGASIGDIIGAALDKDNQKKKIDNEEK